MSPLVPAYDDSFAKMFVGDAIDVLSQLPEKSVHMCVTSPPYFGLRSYLPAGHPDKAKEGGTQATPESYVEWLVEVFRGVWRVLRDDGTAWVVLGDSYASAHACARRNVVGAGSPASDVQRPNRLTGDLKEKDLIGIPWMVAFALRADGWYLRSEITWVKCLSGGAQVYARTQKGDMPMMVKDLVRLDPATVKLWNGEKWTQAVAWEQAPSREGGLEIELRSGERIGCTPEHVWPTQRGNVRADELIVGDILTSCQLPPPDWPDDPARLLNEVGWLCGLYLAEGSMDGDTVRIHGHANESAKRFEFLQQIAEAYHGSATVLTDGNNATIFLRGPIIAAIIHSYVHGKSAHDKGLKVKAWQRHDSFLEQVLMGYLEGDGHYDAKNERWRLGFTRNDRLAGDLRTLAARLGVSLRLRATTTKAFERDWPIYRGELRFTRSLSRQNKQDAEVVAIGKSRARRFWDIAVEDEPHLFALASGVLTHNSAPMPESVRNRPTSATEKVFLFSKQPSYFYDQEAVKERAAPPAGGRRKTSIPGQGNGEMSNSKRFSGLDTTRNMRNYLILNPRPFKGAFYASFPPELPERAIKAGSSEYGVCSTCSAPYRRVVERGEPARDWRTTDTPRTMPNGNSVRSEGLPPNVQEQSRPSRTIGWEPTCSHDAPVEPAVVLDPFSGSGTTLYVARKLGRRSIGIDLDSRNLALLEERLGHQGVLL